MVNLEGCVLDRVTGLPGLDDFKSICETIFADESRQAVLVSLDINNFKFINRIYGYRAGDDLVRKCADFFCRKNVNCLVGARNYVDHFLILTERNGDREEELLLRFDRLHRMFMQKMNEEYPQAVLHITAGAYLVHKGEDSISRAIDRAQIARNSIRGSYQYTVAFYSDEMERKVEAESRVIPMFQRAFDENRIRIYLQPKFAIDSQKIIGAEALARMLDQNGKMIPPADFIPVLEQTGRIIDLDLFVVREVSRLLRRWIDEGYYCYPVSLNLSRRDIVEANFLEAVVNIIIEENIPKELIEFELTETLFMEDFSLVVEKLNWLKLHGFRISMDDFGSGYNCLYTLGSVPVDIIKFDRGFVVNSLTSTVGRKIMSGMFRLFQDVSYDVICEGVETDREEKMVKLCGCNHVQGYLHDKPLPADVFEKKYMVASEEKKPST